MISIRWYLGYLNRTGSWGVVGIEVLGDTFLQALADALQLYSEPEASNWIFRTQTMRTTPRQGCGCMSGGGKLVTRAGPCSNWTLHVLPFPGYDPQKERQYSKAEGHPGQGST